MPKTVKTTYTAINLETGEVYTGIDAPQSITRGETHFWQASKDFFAALLGYGTVESKVVAGMLHRTDPKTNHIACTSAELKKEISCTRDTVAGAGCERHKKDGKQAADYRHRAGRVDA